MNTCGVILFALIFAVATAAVIQSPPVEAKAYVKKVHNNCQNHPDTHLEESVIDRIRAGENYDDPKLKAHKLCMLKGINFINENGDLNVELIKSKLTKYYDGDELTKLQACLVQKNTPEETAAAFSKCQHAVVGLNAYKHYY